MASISSTIKLQDQMSSTLNRISAGLSNMIKRIEAVDNATNMGFDTSEIKSYQKEINSVNEQLNSLKNELNNINKGGISTASIALGNVVGNIITSAANVGVQSIRHMINEYNSNIRMQTQLAASLVNTSTNPEKAYENITEKAKSISERGMFSSGSMVGAGAEFATYFSDSKAIEMMMDTLTDYAAGMSGGKAVDTESMVNYATNLGKIMTGSYQAMNLKGFKFTETQKKIIEGTATATEKAQIQEEMVAKGYENITDEMIQAYAISQSITESWGGMYDAMSQTPTGKITQMFNNLNNVASEVGGRIQNVIGMIADTINKNFDTVTTIINTFSNGVAVVLYIFDNLLNLLLQNLPIVAGTLAVFTAVVVANTVAQTAQAIATFKATVAQQGLNVALGLCPITWIVLGIMAIIAVIVLLAKHIADTTEGVGSAIGVIIGWLNVLKTAVFNVFDTISTIISNRIADIQIFFYGLLETVNGIILAIVENLNKLPFVNIDTTSLQDKATEYANKRAELENSKRDPLESWKGDWVGRAFSEGAAIGDGIASNMDSIFNFDNNPLLDKLGGIEQNTGDTVKALDDQSKEDLAYIRDLAEQETINRFTTAEIKVDMGGISQNISKDTDADAIIDYLVRGVTQGMQSAAEGVYA